MLIPEVEPAHRWQGALQNRRGAVIDRALRRHTDAVVCRLRMRMWAGEGMCRWASSKRSGQSAVSDE
ncbi:hypothetical protein [Kitasatospora sp. NPDC017646]|uniref:hypothetical protein n=1 Tax=Kitasatospora sp. NPDC017646 TaxID=3364024 RepID=UPI0037AFC635